MWLDHPAADVRASAAATILSTKARTCVSGVVPLLEDPDESVREIASRVVSRLGTPAQFESLLDRIERIGRFLEDVDAGVRACAAVALLKLQADGAAARVRDLLAGPDNEMRIAIATAMWDCPIPASASWLAGLLDDPDGDVRYHGALALDEFPEKGWKIQVWGGEMTQDQVVQAAREWWGSHKDAPEFAPPPG